jgi:hypothetical protein
MARVYLLANPSPLINLIYTIDKAVGVAGSPNVRDDVALVQFLLRAVMEDGKDYRIPPGPPLSIDGTCGPQTILYIRSWQQQESKLAAGFAVPMQDGVISPMTNRSGLGSLSHLRYSILSLNMRYSQANGIQKLANIATDPRCPTALLPSIFWK